MTALLGEAGINIKPAKLVDFLDEMAALIDEEKHMELISQVLIYSGALGGSRSSEVTTDVEIAFQGTTQLLERLGFKWTEPDHRHIGNMIRHCKQVNYL